MTSAQRMKQENEKRILQTVWENPGIYRKLVAKKTKLSSQAVTNQVNELVQKNLLLEYSQKTTGKGRAPISLALNYKGIYLLTVDVSLNHMNVFLHNLDGDIVISAMLHLTGREDSLQCLKDLIKQVKDQAGEEYVIPNTVQQISANAFSTSLNLKKVTIPDSVEMIGELAFSQCPNLSDVIYEGTKPQNIAENAFEK